MEATTGHEIHRMEHAGTVKALWFPADASHLVTASHASYGDDIVISRHLLRPADLIQDACSRVTRNLTPEEWKQYLGDEPYRKTCPNLP